MIEFLSIKEMARHLKVHPNTIRNMIKSGKLSALRMNGSKRSPYRIPVSEIHKLCWEQMESVIGSMIDKKMIQSSELRKKEL